MVPIYDVHTSVCTIFPTGKYTRTKPDLTHRIALNGGYSICGAHKRIRVDRGEEMRNSLGSIVRRATQYGVLPAFLGKHNQQQQQQ